MNNEIEVGELIRLNYGIIDKVTNTDYYMQQYIECEKGTYLRENIKTHSKNKIDIVEVGDYVNGSKVLEIMEDMNTGEIHLEMTSNYTNQEIGDCTIYNKDIKTIVTKEAFKEREYVF